MSRTIVFVCLPVPVRQSISGDAFARVYKPRAEQCVCRVAWAGGRLVVVSDGEEEGSDDAGPRAGAAAQTLN